MDRLLAHDAVIRVYDEKTFRVCDRHQLPSTLIFGNKIPPVLAVRRVRGA
jgi:hypothetical protein